MAPRRPATELPDELLALILGCLSANQKSLLTCSLVCRRFNNIARPINFAICDIACGTAKRSNALVSLLQSPAQTISHTIRHLLVNARIEHTLPCLTALHDAGCRPTSLDFHADWSTKPKFFSPNFVRDFYQNVTSLRTRTTKPRNTVPVLEFIARFDKLTELRMMTDSTFSGDILKFPTMPKLKTDNLTTLVLDGPGVSDVFKWLQMQDRMQIKDLIFKVSPDKYSSLEQYFDMFASTVERFAIYLPPYIRKLPIFPRVHTLFIFIIDKKRATPSHIITFLQTVSIPSLQRITIFFQEFAYRLMELPIEPAWLDVGTAIHTLWPGMKNITLVFPPTAEPAIKDGIAESVLKGLATKEDHDHDREVFRVRVLTEDHPLQLSTGYKRGREPTLSEYVSSIWSL